MAIPVQPFVNWDQIALKYHITHPYKKIDDIDPLHGLKEKLRNSNQPILYTHLVMQDLTPAQITYLGGQYGF